MLVTFDVNKKALSSMEKESRLSAISPQEAFKHRVKSDVEAFGSNQKEVVGEILSHGLVETMHWSFAYHYPLILTPDSIWLTIAQGFANHINANAETLRKRFVSHEGKQLIKIRRDDFAKGDPNNDWPSCFGQFSDALSEYIGKKRDLIVSNFSTTGAIEKAVSEVVLMDSMKSYFKYAVHTLCGIPRISLTGTVEDWQNIRQRAENLSEYNLGWWTKSLLPVLDQFVQAAQGKPDINFWDQMYKKSGGSGGPYIGGWVNTLIPYLENYKGNLVQNKYATSWQEAGPFSGVTMDNFPSSLSKTPFKWNMFDTVTYDMEFLGGIIGVHQHKDLSLEPTIGWAIRDAGTSKPGPFDPDEDW